MAIEGGASLALRGLAARAVVRAATRVAESYGAAGRAAWYGYKTVGRILDETVGRFVNPEMTYGFEMRKVYSNGHEILSYPSPLTMRPFEGFGEVLKQAWDRPEVADQIMDKVGGRLGAG
jgi:hypothetical protein